MDVVEQIGLWDSAWIDKRTGTGMAHSVSNACLKRKEEDSFELDARRLGDQSLDSLFRWKRLVSSEDG